MLSNLDLWETLLLKGVAFIATVLLVIKILLGETFSTVRDVKRTWRETIKVEVKEEEELSK